MAKLLSDWLAPFGVDAPAIEINHLRMNSKIVEKGDVFIAKQAALPYVAEVIERGVVVVLIDETVETPQIDVPVVKVPNLEARLIELLSAYYPRVSEVDVIGITGTNGKTTTTQLIAQLAKQLGEGVPVVGTMGAGLVDELVDQQNTTPGVESNYRLLDEFATAGYKVCAMEISSHGLKQKRIEGIDIKTAAFSNLTQDHLDYHGDMADYAASKRQLFELYPNAKAILNVSDSTGRLWFEQWQNQRPIIAVGRFDDNFSAGEHLMYDDLEFCHDGLHFTLKSHLGNVKIASPLFGAFNLDNLVTAIAALLTRGMDFAALCAAAQRLSPVPGRMEQFIQGELTAVVDYAHTPDALQKVLESLRPHTRGDLWCIFGCGGDRDQGKRAQMGAIAERLADKVVVTNDNPRTESEQKITDEILSGITRPETAVVERDRKKAIAQTLALAKDGDVVLIAGKGHETYQIFGTTKVEYDERHYVRQCLNAPVEEMAS